MSWFSLHARTHAHTQVMRYTIPKKRNILQLQSGLSAPFTLSEVEIFTKFTIYVGQFYSDFFAIFAETCILCC